MAFVVTVVIERLSIQTQKALKKGACFMFVSGSLKSYNDSAKFGIIRAVCFLLMLLLTKEKI